MHWQVRIGRLAVALAATLTLCGSASAAAMAATVRGTPQIRGAGTVTAADGYSCTSFDQNDRNTKTDCAQKVVVNDSPFVPVVSITFTATPSSSPAGNWRFAGWFGCPTVSGNQCTISSPPFGAQTFTPTAIFDDFVAPTVTSLTATQSVIEDRKFFFFFGSNEGATFQCRVGSASFTGCSSGQAVTFPSEGSFTFGVRAIDASGNVGPTSSQGVIAVDTALSGGPSGRTNSPDATFGFSTGAGTGFECRLDAAAFAPCGTGTTGSKHYTGLADGAHTFQVRARNGGFVDAVPATRQWTVDTTPPETTITDGPLDGSVTTLLTAQFAFTADEPATFECRVDSAAFAPCTSPESLSGLAAGNRRFEVRARDAAGNVDPTPASRSWTVQPPDADGDGYNAAIDCDDSSADVNPGRSEIVNNDVDDNCDGVKAYDRDHDGSLAGADCDDANAARAPGKRDIPDNGVDENCDGADAVDLDRDDDGVLRPVDCDDRNPAIHPGAVDVPGNALDEDCKGGPATLPPPPPPLPDAMQFGFSFRYTVHGSITKLEPFTIKRAPIGAKVTVDCKGKRCPARKSFKVKKSKQPVKGYVGKKLRSGWRLTFTVRRAGFVTGVRTLTIRRGKRPAASALRCLPPGAKKPAAC